MNIGIQVVQIFTFIEMGKITVFSIKYIKFNFSAHNCLIKV